MARRQPAGRSRTRTRTRANTLLDTGVLVALYDRTDPLHARAQAWLAEFEGQLHSVEPVLSEAAFFLPARLRSALADLAAGGTIRIHHPDTAGLARMAELLRKYESLDPDWADIGLVWLAEHLGTRHIATIDVNDFSVYRIDGRKRFELAMLG